MLPRLQAEEQLDLLNSLMAAGGRAIDDGELRLITRRLEDQVLGNESPRRKAPPLSPGMAKRFAIALTETHTEPESEPVADEKPASKPNRRSRRAATPKSRRKEVNAKR